MDQEEEGIPNGWEELEAEEDLDVREHYQEVEKRWRRLKDKFIDQREGMLGRMEKRLKKVEENTAVIMSNMGKGKREQEKISQKNDRKIKEEKEKIEALRKKNQALENLKKGEKEAEAERLRDELNLAQAMKSAEAREREVAVRNTRVLEKEVIAKSLELAAAKAEGDKEKEEKEEKAKEAKEAAEKERKAMEAAVNASIPSKGRWWMVSKGKQMRRLTVVVLLNQCWGGMTLVIQQRWDNLINKTNELIAAEEQTRQTQLFRVARLGVNAAISRNERRMEIIEGR